MGSVHGWGTKIPQAKHYGGKKKNYLSFKGKETTFFFFLRKGNEIKAIESEVSKHRKACLKRFSLNDTAYSI